MIDGVRRRLGAEDGFIGVWGAVGLALLAVLIYVVAAGFNNDTNQFGSVAVPGKGTVELPDGDVDVYYAEGADPSSGVAVVAPDDLEVDVTDADDSFVEVQTRGGTEAKDTDDGQAILVGEIDVPGEGTYNVETKSDEARQRITPEVTFGEGAFAAMKDRLDSVIDALKGPLGILVLLGIVILIFIPRYRRAKQRQAYKNLP
jgi:hypothetical protein